MRYSLKEAGVALPFESSPQREIVDLKELARPISRFTFALPDPFPVASPRGIRSARRHAHLSSHVLDVACCAGAYVYGSLPFVYALARRRDVDLKRVGSGNVGATNLLAAGGAVRAASGWVFDASKGLAPIFVSRRLGRSHAIAEMAGVCGVAGQCWPLFLGFSGGRGISAFVGASASMDPMAWGASLLPMISGSLWRVAPVWLRLRHAHPVDKSALHSEERPESRPPNIKVRSKSVPLGCFLSALAFPVLVGTRRGFRTRTIMAPTLLSCVVLVRRLTAALPDDATHGPARARKALLYRLLYDRNTSE